MDQIRILLAHRDQVLAKNLYNAIERSPHSVWAGFAISHAEVVQACLADPPPDLILLDTSLEDIPAISVMRAVQSLEKPPKIVGFARSYEAATVRALLRAGASGYLLCSEPLVEILAVLPLVFANKIVLSSSIIATLPD
jgi:DNA-binding NarL/FixJ family response regulator